MVGIRQKIFSGVQYFILPEFLFETCSAYVGDTIKKYISSRDAMFKNIFAFEPDNINYQAMEERFKRLNKEWATPDKIQLIKAGVGSKTTAGTFNQHARTGSSIFEQATLTGDEIKIFALDDFFADQKTDFLKADIQNSEWNMLHGAEKIIRRDLPKMVICIYHNLSDLYKILLWLKGLNLSYKFFVRHHAPKFIETVLYAYH